MFFFALNWLPGQWFHLTPEIDTGSSLFDLQSSGCVPQVKYYKKLQISENKILVQDFFTWISTVTDETRLCGRQQFSALAPLCRQVTLHPSVCLAINLCESVYEARGNICLYYIVFSNTFINRIQTLLLYMQIFVLTVFQSIWGGVF